MIGADGPGERIVGALPSVGCHAYSVGHQLVHAMQSDVSTAGADQDRGRTVEELERELAEAHRREAATAEILRVISQARRPMSQPVFDTIVESAVRLCDERSAASLSSTAS